MCSIGQCDKGLVCEQLLNNTTKDHIYYQRSLTLHLHDCTVCALMLRWNEICLVNTSRNEGKYEGINPNMQGGEV